MNLKIELIVEVNDETVPPVAVARFIRELSEEFDERLLSAGMPNDIWRIVDVYPKEKE